MLIESSEKDVGKMPATAAKHRTKAQHYFKITESATHRASGISLLNFEDLVPPGYRGFAIDPRDRRMPKFPVRPRFLFDKKKGGLPGDFVSFRGLWLISGAFKQFLEKIDGDSVEFAECEVVLPSGEEGPEHWFCNVRCNFDAIDEEKSEFKLVMDSIGEKYYAVRGGAKFILDENKVGDSRLFRLKHASGEFCDEAFKKACRDAGFRAIRFRDVKKL